MADLLSATATITELLPASDKQLTTTAEQQTCILYPQPYAPDKQGPADLNARIFDRYLHMDLSEALSPYG